MLDHVVLNVADAERSLAWYRRVVGLQPVRLAEWRRGEVPFVSLRVDATTIIDLLERARTGENADHLALVIDDDAWDRFLADPPAPIEHGPVRLFGAQGEGEGFYLRDPDGNGVELRHYPTSADPVPARALWMRLETVHAVTYFALESVSAAREIGFRGFWMGYFAFRACPLGPVGPGVVEATFANFAPAMVRRAVPEAWSLADVGRLPLIRAEAAAAALRRIAPDVDEVAAEISPDLEAVIAAAAAGGRPLFSANRDLERLDDPVARLWQLCTTLREHRGDGHVAALLAAGIEGCQSHLLLAAGQRVPPDVYLDNRGWNAQERDQAVTELERRRLLVGGALSEHGRRLRAEVERTTDRLAAQPFRTVLVSDAGSTADRVAGLLAALDRVVEGVVAAEVVPYPNPMGLPPPVPDPPGRRPTG